MRCNIVVKPGWILMRMAEEIAKRVRGVTINSTGYPPRGPGPEEITYFAPMKDIRHMPGVRGLKVGLFTHGEERSLLFIDQFDACVTMNRAMALFLEEHGARNVVTIRPGTEPPKRPMVFGVCGRVYGKGRKGAFLVEHAVGAGFTFRACSRPQTKAAAPCPITHPIEDRSKFYETIDYLVVTSLDEGGPMPVLEAVAHGVPVIAPDVGFCWEFPVIRYGRGSWDSLRSVLEGLAKPPTWKTWAEEHKALFARLLRQRRMAAR